MGNFGSWKVHFSASNKTFLVRMSRWLFLLAAGICGELCSIIFTVQWTYKLHYNNLSTFALFLPRQSCLLQHLCDVQDNPFVPESTQLNKIKIIIRYISTADELLGSSDLYMIWNKHKLRTVRLTIYWLLSYFISKFLWYKKCF